MRLNTRYFALLGLILFAYIIYRVGLSEIYTVILQIDKVYFAVAMLMTFLVVAIKGFKWWLVIKAHNVKYPLLKTIKVWLIGAFVGTLTPARAGEFIKIFYINEKTSTGRALSTVFVDRVIDMFALFVLTFLGMFSLFIWFGAVYTYIFIAIGIGVIVLLLLMNKKAMKFVVKPIINTIIPKGKQHHFKNSFDDFYTAISQLKKKKATLAGILILTLGIWVVSISQGYLMIRALGLPVSFTFFLAIAPIVILITVLPISVIGLGTRDASLIFFFSLLGISAASAVGYALLDVLIVWTQAMIGAVVWLTDKKEIVI